MTWFEDSPATHIYLPAKAPVSFKRSLCENPVLSTVKSLIINTATPARVAFSHRLRLKLTDASAGR